MQSHDDGPVQRTVSALLKTKGETSYEVNGVNMLEMEWEIPEFRSKWPTKMNRVPPELAAVFTPGKIYTILIKQENLKRDKTGQYPTDYFWGLVGKRADAPPAATDAARGGTSSQAITLPQPYPLDSRDRSIQRQVALKAAVELAVADKIDATTPAAITAWATAFARWLDGPSVEENPQEAGEEEPPFWPDADPEVEEELPF